MNAAFDVLALIEPPLFCFQVHKKEDDKMRETAANVAARATTAVGDIASRCQLMVEVKQEKGEYDTSTDPQTSKDGGQKKPSGITEGNTRENQDSGKQDPPVALTTPGELVRLLNIISYRSICKESYCIA